jgi:polyvinyl alcohol dehydrogenase (cytochrome)
MRYAKHFLMPALMLMAAPAWAISGYPPLWQAIYPASHTMTNLPVACNLCHISPGGGLNFNSYGTQIRAGLAQGLSFTLAVQAAESLASTSALGSSFTNLQEITANSQPGWTATSASLPAGIAGLLDPNGVIVPPPVCTPPQILQGGVCVTPPCVPPQVLQGGVCVTVPVCTPPQVLQGGVCVTPPPPPPPPPSGPVPPDVSACGGGWPMAGYGIHNTRYNVNESSISPTTVGTLRLESSTQFTDSVLPTLSVQAGYVYASDKRGLFSKINTKTGVPVWTVNAGTLTGQPTTIIRTTPTLCQGMVVVAGWSVNLTGPSTAYVMALSQRTGALIWKALVDTDQGARIYQSPIIYRGTVYIGVAGVAAELTSFLNGSGQVAPTFRGSIVALSLSSGAQMWKTYTVPPGYSGGGVWADTLSLDENTGTLYAGIGNNYSIPPIAMACIREIGDDAGNLCQSKDNHIDGIMALNSRDGTILWHKQIIPTDAYGCGVGCVAAIAAPDYDFPTGPQLFTATINGAMVNAVGAGHKNGAYIALDRASGDILWAKKIGPASSLGGIERPCATNGVVIYCPEMNFPNAAVTLLNGTVTTGGYWTAMLASDGTVLWQTANPTGYKSLSALTLANGVVFGCSLDPTGVCYAMSAATGAILWQYTTGGSNGGGVSVYNGRVYIGVGYDALEGLIPLGNNAGKKVLVFTLPNQPADPGAAGGETDD